MLLPGEHPWGVYFEPGFPWEWARTEKTDRYRFLLGRDTHVPYFDPDDSTVERFNLFVSIPDGNREASELRVVEREGLQAARAHGITVPACLVELGVNSGRGGTGTHFIATSVRVLDGTEEYPWSLGDRLMTLRSRFDAARKSHRDGLKAEFRASRTRLQGNPGGAILRELPMTEIVVYRPAWHSDARLLDVFFGYKRQGGFWIKSNRPRETRPVKQAEPPAERGVSYSTSMGAHYVMDANGTIVTEEIYSPQSFLDVPWQQRLTASLSAGPIRGVEAAVRWADRAETQNASGPHTFTGSSRTSVVVE